MKRQRSNSGNMITMVALSALVVIVVCFVGYGFYLFYAEQKRGQGQADALVMKAVPVLNQYNYIGQMNYMVARSRELVYMSRQMSNLTCNKDMAFCAPLAQQLLQESSASAQDLDKERMSLAKRVRWNLRTVFEEYNLHATEKPIFSIPGWQTYQPKVREVAFGSVKGVNSNVFHNEIFPDLRLEDERAKYIDAKTNLYKGNINAKLPPPDQALDFKLCSLPASVLKSVAPPRLLNPEFFQESALVFEDSTYVENKLDQLPSALAVKEDMDVAVQNNKNQVLVAAFAATEGSAAPPEQPPPGSNRNEKDQNEADKHAPNRYR